MLAPGGFSRSYCFFENVMKSSHRDMLRRVSLGLAFGDCHEKELETLRNQPIQQYRFDQSYDMLDKFDESRHWREKSWAFLSWRFRNCLAPREVSVIIEVEGPKLPPRRIMTLSSLPHLSWPNEIVLEIEEEVVKARSLVNIEMAFQCRNLGWTATLDWFEEFAKALY